MRTERTMTMNKKDIDASELDVPVSEEEPEKKETDSAESEESEKAPDITDKLDKITAELGEANDKYLRLYAEYDNYRKRTAKEKTQTYGDATVKCIQEILPVLDSFERALDAECTDEKFKSGMVMIHNQLTDILKKLGVTEMEALGCQFDPNIHNAIKKTEDESLGENEICEVFQKGYMLGDRVIRHAVVAVAN